MNVNQLMAKLRTMQKEGYGTVKVHMAAHDNSMGESQGEVCSVSHYEKEPSDRLDADKDLYDLTPEEMVYLHG